MNLFEKQGKGDAAEEWSGHAAVAVSPLSIGRAAAAGVALTGAAPAGKHSDVGRQRHSTCTQVLAGRTCRDAVQGSGCVHVVTIAAVTNRVPSAGRATAAWGLARNFCGSSGSQLWTLLCDQLASKPTADSSYLERHLQPSTLGLSHWVQHSSRW